MAKGVLVSLVFLFMFVHLFLEINCLPHPKLTRVKVNGKVKHIHTNDKWVSPRAMGPGGQGSPPAMGAGGMNGQGMNGQGMNGQGMNGQGMNGQGMNGQGMNGQGMNGQGMNGQGMNGQGMNGQGMNGQGMNGQGMNGQAMGAGGGAVGAGFPSGQQFALKFDNGRCLFPENDQTSSGAKLVVPSEVCGSDLAKFTISDTGNLKNVKTGFCVQPESGSDEDDSPLVIKEGCDRKWAFIMTSAGSLKLEDGGKCVQPAAGGTRPSQTEYMVLRNTCDVPETKFTIWGASRAGFAMSDGTAKQIGMSWNMNGGRNNGKLGRGKAQG